MGRDREKRKKYQTEWARNKRKKIVLIYQKKSESIRNNIINAIYSMDTNEIKSLNPIECPHCHQTIVVEFNTGAPKLNGVYTPKMLEAAKEEALARIDELGLPKEITKSTVDWIKDPNTIFSPSDVDEIIKNIEKTTNEDEPGEEE